MIKIENLKKYYGDKLVLDIDKLEIKQGEQVAIVGANGSGKSTLMKLLSKTLKASDGTVSIDGEVLYMPQSCYVFNKSVKKNITLGLKNADEKVDVLMKKLEIADLASKNAKGLSGGEIQKVSLCRVLARPCNFLLLDEPTSNMDLNSTAIAENAIAEYIKEQKATLIFSTHSPKQARQLANRIIILNQGVIVEDGDIEKTINAPKTKWGEKFLSQWVI